MVAQSSAWRLALVDPSQARERGDGFSMQAIADMAYSVDFFDLQLRFAGKVAELSGCAFEEVVGKYTNIYVRLAMGRHLDPGNPEWLQYLRELMAAGDQAAWTHAVHRRRLHLRSGPTLAATEGCFSYEVLGVDRVRLHFHVGAGESSLSSRHREQRLHELSRLFARLKANSPVGTMVVGASWLYNLDRYRSLFPERYLASLRPIEHPYQRMPLWGQFLARDRSVRQQAQGAFVSDLARLSRLSELPECFPFSVLSTSAPAAWFYEHFGICDAAQFFRSSTLCNRYSEKGGEFG